MSTKSIAVLLATGKQGRNVVKALLNIDNKDSYHVIALTRDPLSVKAQKLYSYPDPSSGHSLEIVKCNVHNKQELQNVFKKFNVWGVYCNTIFSLTCDDTEFKDGKACIDAAIESNVKFFIHSTVHIPQGYPVQECALIYSKYRIDEYLKQSVMQNPDEIFTHGWVSIEIPWNMDNLLEYWIPKNGYLQIPLMKHDKDIPMVACENIGDIAAAFFAKNIQINNKHMYTAVSDILSPEQMCEILSNVSGSKVTFDSNGPLYLFWLEKLGVSFLVEGFKVSRYINEHQEDTIDIAHKIQCYEDLSDKMIEFQKFAEVHFKDKYLGESVIRKLCKYGALIAAVVAIAGVGVHHFRK